MDLNNMCTIKCFIFAVLIAVTDAEEAHEQGTISDDLDLKPADLLTSLSAEITKSDVEITLSGLRVAEEAAADTTEANDGARIDKPSENLTQLRSDQEASRMSSIEDAQKITHTSDDNASFIHVKEKIARQGSDEELAEADEQSRIETVGDFLEHSETKQASVELKKSEESPTVPEKNGESKAADKKEEDISEKSDSIAADDIQKLFKSDDAEDEIDPMAQSRRMLSFDRKLLDTVNVPNVETEPSLVAKSGQNNYEHIPLGADDDHHAHFNHHGDLENRHGKRPGANPLVFPQPHAPPPLPPFHSPGQPLQPQFQLPVNAGNPVSLEKSLPAVLSHLNQYPHLEETGNHHVNQHFKAMQQLIPHQHESMQPVQSLRPLHFAQTLQQEPPLQALPSMHMFQPSQTLQTFESWQPFQSFQSLPPPQPSLAISSPSPSAASSKTLAPSQLPQMKIDNILYRLQDASHQHHHMHTGVANQYSDAFPRNWNVGGYSSFL